MNIKEVLAANLKLLMAANPRLDTLPKITAASEGRLSNGKLDRIRRAAVATDIDAVSELAQVFNITPAALLHEHLCDPDDPEESLTLNDQTAGTTVKLSAAMNVLQGAINRADKTTRLALEPLFSAFARDKALSANSSHLIIKLLADSPVLAKNPSNVSNDIDRVKLPTGGFFEDGTSNSAKKKRG